MGTAPLITLLTDFGTRDGYVGAMKGVIAGLAPGVPVVDISHEIEPQATRRAGLVWASAVPWYPDGCVHVAVVDPGVGTRRAILAARTPRGLFLAPEGELLGHVLTRRRGLRVHRVSRRELFLQPVSATFHGRDIFAPVAARLATGLPLEAVGPLVPDYDPPSPPRPRRRRRGATLEVRGEIIDADRFGNLTTSITPPEDLDLLLLRAGGFEADRLRRTYGDVGDGDALALVGSTERVEIAVRGGSALEALGLRVGDRVLTVWAPTRATGRTSGRRR